MTGGPDGKLTCWQKNKAHTLKPENPEEQETGAEFSLHVKDLRAMKVISRDVKGIMVCALDAPGNDEFFTKKIWRIVTAGGAPRLWFVTSDYMMPEMDALICQGMA